MTMNMKEKAAYLKGLAEGLKPDTTKAEGRLISELIDLVGGMAGEIARQDEEIKTLREYVEELDQDLGAVEEDLYDDEDDFDEDDDEEEYDDDDFFRIQCPSCGEDIFFDEEADPSKLICPACGESIECEFECDGDCGECDGCESEDEE